MKRSRQEQKVQEQEDKTLKRLQARRSNNLLMHTGSDVESNRNKFLTMQDLVNLNRVNKQVNRITSSSNGEFGCYHKTMGGLACQSNVVNHLQIGQECYSFCKSHRRTVMITLIETFMRAKIVAEVEGKRTPLTFELSRGNILGTYNPQEDEGDEDEGDEYDQNQIGIHKRDHRDNDNFVVFDVGNDIRVNISKPITNSNNIKNRLTHIRGDVKMEYFYVNQSIRNSVGNSQIRRILEANSYTSDGKPISLNIDQFKVFGTSLTVNLNLYAENDQVQEMEEEDEDIEDLQDMKEIETKELLVCSDFACVGLTSDFNMDCTDYCQSNTTSIVLNVIDKVVSNSFATTVKSRLDPLQTYKLTSEWELIIQHKHEILFASTEFTNAQIRKIITKEPWSKIVLLHRKAYDAPIKRVTVVDPSQNIELQNVELQNWTQNQSHIYINIQNPNQVSAMNYPD